MIEINTLEITGFAPAIHGMRNPLNSWSRSDSYVDSDTEEWIDCAYEDFYGFKLGLNDATLATSLAQGGPVHAKYRRMLTVYADVTAPLYWWKEFDTYRCGVEKNSCSTMHTITQKEFTLDDFSREHLGVWIDIRDQAGVAKPYMIDVWNETLESVVHALNLARKCYLDECNPDIRKQNWWQIIQLLPASYNQRRTVMMSYEALAHMYVDRRAHKLDEWREFCAWVRQLPYFNPIICPPEKGVS